MISIIVGILRDAKYIVHTRYQEKTPPKEIVVTIDDMENIEEEMTPQLYELASRISLQWYDDDSAEILAMVKTIIPIVENGVLASTSLTKGTFKFKQPEIKILNEMYRVRLVCEYIEVINVD